ncbi:MAG: ROK family protein [Candidatus Doudnabacteria bacterium]|nr:ROK family protein [Candidatus Doudnabacteria bacterium]
MSKLALGIDVGGTKVAAGLVNNAGKITRFSLEPTSQQNLLGQLVRIAKTYRGYSSIGLGMPGQVLAAGKVVRLPNVKRFHNVDLKKIFERKFRKLTTVNNDADCFALAESLLGWGRNNRCVVGVILGTGTGVGVVINKKIFQGKDGLVGEFDHLLMPNGELLRFYVKKARPFKNAAQAKSYLKILLNHIVISYNPDIIVLAGGWSNLSGMQRLAQSLTKNTGNYKTITPVKISKITYPGLVGAGLAALKR